MMLPDGVRDEDPVTPVSIEHRCEEIIIGGEVEQHYNYLVYALAYEGRRYAARAYLDQIEEVSLYGPFGPEGDDKRLPGPIPEPVLAFFMRRYRTISVLGPKGYVILWTASSP